MCSEGRHPPESWGHLTLVHFFLNEDGHWTCVTSAEDMPDQTFCLDDEGWKDPDGHLVDDAVGVAWLNRRCFGN